MISRVIAWWRRISVPTYSFMTADHFNGVKKSCFNEIKYGNLGVKSKGYNINDEAWYSSGNFEAITGEIFLLISPY